MKEQNKSQVKLVTDKDGHVIGANTTYRTDQGDKLKIKFGWKVKEGCHGAYCQSEYNY